MEKRRIIFFRLLVTLLFAVACSYALFDSLREADFSSDNKYEERDSEVLYAEKGSHLDGVFVSANLFPPLPDTLFEFLPTFFSPDIFSVVTIFVLTC